MVFKPVCSVCGQEIRPYHLFYRPVPGQHICISCSEKENPEEEKSTPTKKDSLWQGGSSRSGGNGLEPLVRLLSYAPERSVWSRKTELPHFAYS